jgi:hypothetical protein
LWTLWDALMAHFQVHHYIHGVVKQLAGDERGEERWVWVFQ